MDEFHVIIQRAMGWSNCHLHRFEIHDRDIGNADYWEDERKFSLKDVAVNEHFVYEYHWEWNFPATPTTFAIRTDSEKYVFYHGVWDRNGFYDLKTDPHERHNLIRVPAYRDRILELREKLFDELDSSGGLSIPIRRPKNEQFYDRKLRR